MGIAVFRLAPVAAVVPAVVVADEAVLKSMAAYSALFSGSSISIEGTSPQLCLSRHFYDSYMSFQFDVMGLLFMTFALKGRGGWLKSRR